MRSYATRQMGRLLKGLPPHLLADLGIDRTLVEARLVRVTGERGCLARVALVPNPAARDAPLWPVTASPAPPEGLE